MSFFENNYFTGEFFKKEYFGGAFYQNKFFDATTLAHPLSALVVSETELNVNCNRTITGIFDPLDFKVILNGSEIIPSDSTATGKDMVLTVTDVIAAGDVVTISYAGSDINNFCIIEDFKALNSLVLARKRKRK